MGSNEEKGIKNLEAVTEKDLSTYLKVQGYGI